MQYEKRLRDRIKRNERKECKRLREKIEKKILGKEDK